MDVAAIVNTNISAIVPVAMDNVIDLDVLVDAIKSYPGVTRKHPIKDVVAFLPDVVPGSAEPNGPQGRVLADFGEDSAVVALDDDPDGEVLLVATDGIMATLLEANPYWAGYVSVLVNAMDIAATGGVPFCMVDVISLRTGELGTRLLEGIRAGVEKFRVPMLGGHTHPDAECSAIDVAVVGRARRSEVIYSHTAQVGDSIVVGIDTEGEFHPSFRYSFDTSTKQTPEEVARRMFAARRLSQRGLLSGGKDISNPGTLGTLGMLLETSGKGAVVDPTKVPQPRGVDPVHWLLCYQGCGFVLTCSPEHENAVLDGLVSNGLASATIGHVTEGDRLQLDVDDEERTLFDFSREPLTGCGPPER
jgi:putative methanogenesis marker protein 2